MATPKIAIIGAGPAGCLLARLLHLAGIPTTVYEGEASPNYRSQGGSLDLHTNTGLAALREAGLWDEFQKHARYDGQYMAIVDKNLKYYLAQARAQHTLNHNHDHGEVESHSQVLQCSECNKELREAFYCCMTCPGASQFFVVLPPVADSASLIRARA